MQGLDDVYSYLAGKVASEGALLRERLAGSRCLLLDRFASPGGAPTFVQAKDVFFELEVDVAPFGYHNSSLVRSLRNQPALLALLGAHEAPNITCCQAWLAQLAQLGVLAEGELETAAKIVKMVANFPLQSIPSALMCPCSTGTVSPPTPFYY